jgi:hypothetical protein
VPARSTRRERAAPERVFVERSSSSSSSSRRRKRRKRRRRRRIIIKPLIHFIKSQETTFCVAGVRILSLSFHARRRRAATTNKADKKCITTTTTTTASSSVLRRRLRLRRRRRRRRRLLLRCLMRLVSLPLPKNSGPFWEKFFFQLFFALGDFFSQKCKYTYTTFFSAKKFSRSLSPRSRSDLRERAAR